MTTFYVNSKTGSDDWDGSKYAPWRTSDRVANAVLYPGDEVLFYSGYIYGPLFLSRLHGTENNPIYLGMYYEPFGSGKNPQFKSDSKLGTDRGLITLRDCSHITMSYLDTEKSQTNGVVVIGSRENQHSDIRLFKCGANNNKHTGIVVATGGVTLDGCTANGNGQSQLDHGIYLSQSDGVIAQNFVVKDCTTEKNSGYGIHAYRCAGGTISGNDVRGNLEGGLLLSNISNNDTFNIRNNEVRKNKKYGINISQIRNQSIVNIQGNNSLDNEFYGLWLHDNDAAGLIAVNCNVLTGNSRAISHQGKTRPYVLEKNHYGTTSETLITWAGNHYPDLASYQKVFPDDNSTCEIGTAKEK